LYKDQGRYGEAELLCKRALAINEKALGPDHPDVATSLSSMASLYYPQGRYGEAELLCKRALAINEKALGPDHSDVATSLDNLADLYDAQGRYAKAEPLLLKANQILLSNITRNFPALSEREKTNFLNTINYKFEAFNSFALRRAGENPGILGAMLNNQLAIKALLLSATTKVNRRIRNSSDSTLINQYNAWKSKKEYLAKLYGLPKDKVSAQGIKLDSLETGANELEKELSRRSELFASVYEKRAIRWQEVQASLKPNEAAVEIIRFNKYDKRWTDTRHYAALIITTDTKEYPRLVLLGNGNDLENEYFEQYREFITGYAVGSYNDSLYGYYWSKIAGALKGITRVYLSLDGVYNKVSLPTLRNPVTEKYLLEEMDITIVTNTKDLVERRHHEGTASNTADLFGFPRYDLSKEEYATLAANIPRGGVGGVELYGSVRDSLERSRGYCRPLAGTKQEVKEIGALLKSKGWDCRIYLDSSAIEERVKAVKSPRVLMISTHGYFLSDVEMRGGQSLLTEMEQQKAVENPLLRSGLILAGACNPREDSVESEMRFDDGKLTANEVMNMDLDNTELVVLSACETGLGKVRNGEGVYGLQRAFQVAGANSVLMSLWKVDDATTKELMTSFFKTWLGGMDKHEAFKQAQKEVRVHHPHPYYWGAFVMVGE